MNFSAYSGQVTTNLTQATSNVKLATNLVLKLTKDVKIGVGSRSELLKAMQDLDSKIKIAKNLSNKKTLNGYLGDSSLQSNIVMILGVILAVFFLIR